MTVVVDASVAVQWLFRLDGQEPLTEIIRPGEALIAPDLIFAEIGNAAWKLVTYEKLLADKVAAVVQDAPRLFDEIISSRSLVDRALAIGIQLGYPVYDCFYLALAERRDCKMATADQRLASRCARTPFAKRLITARSGRRR